MASRSEPEFSVIVPAYREGAAIVRVLDALFEALPERSEVLVVFDEHTDPTVGYLESYRLRESRLRPQLNTYGRGPANALRFGMEHATSPTVVVMMGDGSDDPTQIVTLAELVRSGAVVAAASRYMRGGRQIGGPVLKRTLSRLAGLSLHLVAGVPIRDATSAFKGYSRQFVTAVGIESTEGFEISLELVAKAHRLRLPMVEIPTVWTDRTEGESHFRLLRWLPAYLRWYWFAFGPALTVDDLVARAGGVRK